MPPPLPNHPSDTRAAASQHVGRSRCRNRGGLLGTNTDRTEGTGDRQRRLICLARTQIVEAEAAATVVPPKPAKLYRKPLPIPFALPEASPPRYPQPHFKTNFGCGNRPSPPLSAGTARLLRQQLPPAAVPARALGSRPFPGIVTGRARASRYRRHPSTRQGFGTRGGL